MDDMRGLILGGAALRVVVGAEGTVDCRREAGGFGSELLGVPA